jgi:hypothetical protein
MKSSCNVGMDGEVLNTQSTEETAKIDHAVKCILEFTANRTWTSYRRADARLLISGIGPHNPTKLCFC